MAFEDVTFPYYPMKHGITKTIIDPVSVVSNGNREYRIKRQAWERYEWTLPTQTMTDQQKEDIRIFLSERSHSLNSFIFIDPDMPTSIVDVDLEQHYSIFWKYNLPLTHTAPEIGGTHPQFGAIGDAVFWKRDGTQYGPTNVVLIDGIPILNTGWSSGIITVDTMTPKFVVRLASTLSYALAALDTNNETLGVEHASIKLIEVFGEY